MRRIVTLVTALALAAGAPVVSGVAPSSAASPSRTGCRLTLASYPVLRPGARGPAVRTLQCVLDDDGFGPVAVDGFYGPQTRAAVRRVEAGFEGPAQHPGRIDHGYWTLLLAHRLPDRTLRAGDHGAAVRTLQRTLRAAGGHLAVDGRFGPQTRGVLRQFQRANHLRASGVLDANTRFLLHMGAVLHPAA